MRHSVLLVQLFSITVLQLAEMAPSRLSVSVIVFYISYYDSLGGIMQVATSSKLHYNTNDVASIYTRST